jgi:hypothetical protein
MVYAPEADEEAIALAENVNRLEMNPLDEALTFKKMLDAGVSIGEVARKFARSKANIYKRVRLCNLTEDLKTMFRENKINITYAAYLASLPTEDQAKFCKKYNAPNANPITEYYIQQFIYTTQRCKLSCVADEECAKCEKRTDNTNPSLFDEGERAAGMEDVCLDSECYSAKMNAIIASGIEGALEKCAAPEDKIIFEHYFPKFLPPKTTSLNIGGKEYALLKDREYYTNDETLEEAATANKQNTAWEVGTDHPTGKVTVQRVSVRKHEPYHYSSEPADPVKKLGLDKLEEYQDNKAQAVEIAKELAVVKVDKWEMRRKIHNIIINTVLEEWAPPKMAVNNYARLYIEDKIQHAFGSWASPDKIKRLNAEFAALTGYENTDAIPITPETQSLFHYLIIQELGSEDVIDLDDVEDDKRFAQIETNLFWKYAAYTREKYKALYKAVMREVIAAALEP